MVDLRGPGSRAKHWHSGWRTRAQAGPALLPERSLPGHGGFPWHVERVRAGSGEHLPQALRPAALARLRTTLQHWLSRPVQMRWTAPRRRRLGLPPCLTAWSTLQSACGRSSLRQESAAPRTLQGGGPQSRRLGSGLQAQVGARQTSWVRSLPGRRHATQQVGPYLTSVPQEFPHRVRQRRGSLQPVGPTFPWRRWFPLLPFTCQIRRLHACNSRSSSSTWAPRESYGTQMRHRSSSSCSLGQL